MTVSTSYDPLTYTGNGVTTAFAVTWSFDAAADLVVTERVIATGAETVKTLTTDYTVSGGSGSTGTVTAVSAPAATVQWVISRSTTRSQAVDYAANDDFPAETHEGALDKLTRVDQEQDGDLAKTLKFPGTDSTTISAVIPSSVDRASKLLGFSSTGAPEAVAKGSITGNIIPSAFMETVLDDADAATVRATLELGNAATGTIGTDVQAYDADIPTVAASQAEMEAGTETALRSMTPQRVSQAISALGGVTVAVGSFTRDMTTATGTQAVTGVGFQPSAIAFLAVQNNATGNMSAGWSAGSSDNQGIIDRHVEGADTWTSSTLHCIQSNQGASVNYQGKIDSFDSDGFTISWTKQGATTGTLTIKYLALR